MKTKNCFYLVFIALFVAPLLSFAQQDSVANQQFKKFPIPELVTKITTSGTFTVILSQSNEPSITFDKSLENQISFKIKDDAIRIDATQGQIWVKLKNISNISTNDVTNIKSEGTITSPSLHLTLNDVSSQVLNVSTENIKATISDASKLSLNGKTLNLGAITNDASKLKAELLEATNVEIITNDASVAWVNPIDVIKGHTNDASVLHYFEKAKTVNIESNDGSTSKKFNEISIDGNEQTLALPLDSIKNIVTDILVDIDSNFNGSPVKEKSNFTIGFFNKKRFDGNWGGIMLGFNNLFDANGQMDVPIGYEYLEVDFTGSRTFALNLLEQNFSLIRNKLGITTGVGFQWYNYRFAKNAQLFANQSAIDGRFDTANASIYEKSKLSYTMLNIPLLLEFQTNPNHNKRSFHINAGVIFGVKLCSHTKTIIDDGAVTKITVSDDFNLNPIRLDATASIGYDIINLFASYSLTPLFKEKQGPKLYPFTAGIYLLLW